MRTQSLMVLIVLSLLILGRPTSTLAHNWGHAETQIRIVGGTHYSPITNQSHQLHLTYVAVEGWNQTPLPVRFIARGLNVTAYTTTNWWWRLWETGSRQVKITIRFRWPLRKAWVGDGCCRTWQEVIWGEVERYCYITVPRPWNWYPDITTIVYTGNNTCRKA